MDHSSYVTFSVESTKRESLYYGAEIKQVATDLQTLDSAPGLAGKSFGTLGQVTMDGLKCDYKRFCLLCLKQDWRRYLHLEGVSEQEQSLSSVFERCEEQHEGSISACACGGSGGQYFGSRPRHFRYVRTTSERTKEALSRNLETVFSSLSK